MGLVIHDLCPAEWEKLSHDYNGWDVVSDSGQIRPCSGCFCCWHKMPGQCVVRDGYENMGARIHRTDEITVISRYTFGGFSGFVKNVFDRSLGYVLPQFEIIGGESHHKKRYDEDKPFTFIFYGPTLSEEEKDSARRYVQAVCTNIRGHVKDVVFRERGDAVSVPPAADELSKAGAADADSFAGTSSAAGHAASDVSGKVLILNGSMRYEKGNSVALARHLSAQLGKDSVTIALQKTGTDAAALPGMFAEASDIVLCMPLYVDGLPSQVIRFMERMLTEYKGGPKRVYVLANMGLYESRQLRNLFAAVRQWCVRIGFTYCGGLGVAAGEMIGVLIRQMRPGAGPTKETAEGLSRLAQAIDRGAQTEDIYAGAGRFPRWLYILIANSGWNRMAKKNGLKRADLYKRL